MEIDQDMSELPVEITNKLSKTPLESPTWHTDVQKGNTSPPTITPIENTTDSAMETSKIADDTSGTKKLFKNFIYNVCVYKYHV